jgi:hypothetical protein
LAGYVTTIAGIAGHGKCRLAFESIAPCYATAIGMLDALRLLNRLDNGISNPGRVFV